MKKFIVSALVVFSQTVPSFGSTFQDEYFTCTYPSSFEVSPKLLQTHEKELFTKSIDIKGYNFGVTVSLVSIL